MKLRLFAIALFVGHFTFAQTSSDSITNKNYYDRFQDIKGHSINWLRQSDAIPTIIDELLKSGIAYHTIGVGKLLKLNDTTRLVVTVYFKKGDKEYGFLYEATHGIPLNRKDRDFLTDKKKVYYVQAENDVVNGVDFMRVDPLPDNIFLLKQTCYWFQFDNSGTKYDVNKEVAKKILRQDIDDYLKKL
ncbi:hypothetical protein [Parafilimonas terrae]|uniref:DUF4468 domain-containing protein n=1 Tax=Parafilimonas terrae TaxID=1465490 RepID=A0A1I5ZGV7_9BACT|nr:hypothetical protein [Parafilimonas terrae]SFQ55696.1 hypothetical protein SAMN05444277_1283 [Parafilimonas terrae]